MKIIEKAKATDTLGAYADHIDRGPVIVTDQGKPVAALLPIENADLETVSLSTNPKFLEIIARSQARLNAEGGISSEEMRRRLKIPPRSVAGVRASANGKGRKGKR